MSRIGKKPVAIPAGVTVQVDDHVIAVKGSKGELKMSKRPEVKVAVDAGQVCVSTVTEDRQARAFQGTTRALVAKMVEGVTKGFEKKLEISGVGYEAALEGNILVLKLGFNKPVRYEVPTTVKVDVPNATTVFIRGIDSQQVGNVAASIRKLRKPEPYKGKGIKYSTEVVKRKAGKAFGSSSG